jgi:hypothetical protein
MTLALPAADRHPSVDPEQLADPAILDRLDTYHSPPWIRSGGPLCGP